MRFLAAICVLALSVNAQFGPAGIVRPNGKNIQFTHDMANNIAVVGHSGIVFKDGRNLQFDHDGNFDISTLSQARPVTKSAPVSLPEILTGAIVGQSGIVNPNGKNVQFTHDQAGYILLSGPSGAITRDGKNIQFRPKRSVGFVSRKGNIGTSGILRADGTTTLFDHDTAHNIVVAGPSGIVTRDGRNMQLTSDLHVAFQGTPSVAAQPKYNSPVLLDGPSGTILEDGTLIQKRAKRSAGLPLRGPSGMITEDGTPIQFKTAGAYIVLEGPSGYVMSDGTLIQKRAKRSAGLPLRGPSGMITKDGTPIQFKTAGAYIVLEGPSGYVMSDGTLIQKTA